MNVEHFITTMKAGGYGVWRIGDSGQTALIGVSESEINARKLARADRFGVPEWVPVFDSSHIDIALSVIGALMMCVGLIGNNVPFSIVGAAIYIQHKGVFQK